MHAYNNEKYEKLITCKQMFQINLLHFSKHCTLAIYENEHWH